MRKRRKARYTWLPVRGSQVDSSEPPQPTDFATYGDVQIQTVDELPSGAVVALIQDEPSEDEQELQHESMADAIGSDYVVKRIVGKIFANAEYVRVGNLSALNCQPIHFKAGIFVARADDDLEVPIAWNSSGTANYGPNILRNVREPWLWQRSWILGTGSIFPQAAVVDPGDSTADLTFFRSQAYPPSNVSYGSVMDGPHVDIKVSRRVSQDCRLWMVMSAEVFPTRVRLDSSVFHNVYVRYDFRALGALRKARQSSAF